MLYLFNPITLLLLFIIYAKTTGTAQSISMFIGAFVDCIVNLTWFTLIFMDIPKEWLLTKRVERLKSTDGYRGKLAMMLCKLLNLIMNNHCV